MEVPQSHSDTWDSGSNTMDKCTMMCAADSNVAPSDYHQRLVRDEDMTPPHSGDAQVDPTDVYLNLDDLEQFDWECAPELNWEPEQHLPPVPLDELQCAPTSQTIPVEFPTVDQLEEYHEAGGEHESGLEDQSVDWERAPELNWEPQQCLPPVPLEEFQCLPMSQTIPVDFPTADQFQEYHEAGGEHESGLADQSAEWGCPPELNWEPSQQHLPQLPMEELQCPPTDQTIPVEFPTADQLQEPHAVGGEHESGLVDQSVERGGECSGDRIDKATSPPVLPSGGKIGVTFHKKNKQWEAHLWVRGQRLRGRKKKGVQIFLGNYETEEEAKLAHDRAAIKLGIPPSAKGEPYPLNFPAAVHASYMQEHAQWTARDFLWKIRRTSNKFSKGKSSLKGVTVRKQSVKRGREWVPKYEAKVSLTAKESGDDLKRTFMLGNFESEEQAGQAYDLALLFLHQHLPEVEQLRYITNFRPSTYAAADIETMATKLPRRS